MPSPLILKVWPWLTTWPAGTVSEMPRPSRCVRTMREKPVSASEIVRVTCRAQRQGAWGSATATRDQMEVPGTHRRQEVVVVRGALLEHRVRLELHDEDEVSGRRARL